MAALSVRDRTSDFFAAADRLRPSVHVKRPPTAGSNASISARSSANTATLYNDASAKNFSRITSEVSRGIADTAARLEKLTALAKDKSLFNDRTLEMEQLTGVIKLDLQSLTHDIEGLEEFVSRNKSGQAQSDSHTERVVNTLRSDVLNATKSFAEVLQLRSQSLKVQSDRKKQFSSGRTLTTQRSRPNFAHIQANPHVSNFDEENHPLLSLQSQALQELEQKDLSNEYLESRAEAVEQIEQTIQELGQMYQKLATIVAMQGETAIRIDDNVTTALDHVTGGHRELLKMMDSVTSNRWLILKVFVTLILFAIFFIIFVA